VPKAQSFCPFGIRERSNGGVLIDGRQAVQEFWVPQFRDFELNPQHQFVKSLNIFAGDRIAFILSIQNRLPNDLVYQVAESVSLVFQRGPQKSDNCRLFAASLPEFSQMSGVGCS
jgi:hypothetical protein